MAGTGGGGVLLAGSTADKGAGLRWLVFRAYSGREREHTVDRKVFCGVEPT